MTKMVPPVGYVRWYAHGDIRGADWFCARCDMFVPMGDECPSRHGGTAEDIARAKRGTTPSGGVMVAADGDGGVRGLGWRPADAPNRWL